MFSSLRGSCRWHKLCAWLANRAYCVFELVSCSLMVIQARWPEQHRRLSFQTTQGHPVLFVELSLVKESLVAPVCRRVDNHASDAAPRQRTGSDLHPLIGNKDISRSTLITAFVSAFTWSFVSQLLCVNMCFRCSPVEYLQVLHLLAFTLKEMDSAL